MKGLRNTIIWELQNVEIIYENVNTQMTKTKCDNFLGEAKQMK